MYLPNFQNWFKLNYNIHIYNTRYAFFGIDNAINFEHPFYHIFECYYFIVDVIFILF